MTLHLYICIVWSTQKWVWFNCSWNLTASRTPLGTTKSRRNGEKISSSPNLAMTKYLFRGAQSDQHAYGVIVSLATMLLVIVPDISSFWSTHEFIPHDQTTSKWWVVSRVHIPLPSQRRRHRKALERHIYRSRARKAVQRMLPTIGLWSKNRGWEDVFLPYPCRELIFNRPHQTRSWQNHRLKKRQLVKGQVRSGPPA